MNKSKITEYDCIDFLIGTQRACSNTEAERVCPHEKDGAAHDPYMRQLHRLVPTTERSVIGHWSGKHKQVVSGINLVTMLWADGGRHIPADRRIYRACYELCGYGKVVG